MPPNYKRKKRGKRYSPKKNDITDKKNDITKKKIDLTKRIGALIKEKSGLAVKQIRLALRNVWFSIIQCGYMTGKFFLRLFQRIASIRIQKNGAFAAFLKTLYPVLLGALVVYGALVVSGIDGYIVQSVTDAFSETAYKDVVTIPAIALVALISFIPVVSPLLGQGLLITLVFAAISGLLLASGQISPFIALPALFAIDVQLGNKIAPASAMGETEPETLAAGVPEIYFTRLITLPAAVAAAYFFSFIVFK